MKLKGEKVDYSQSAVIQTSGDGCWTKVQKPVTIVGVEMIEFEDEDEQLEQRTGSLRVYFDVDTWNQAEDNYIYTDKGFLAGLKALLTALGVSADTLRYSEQGRQGRNYVDFDVDEVFIKSYEAAGYENETFYRFNENGRILE
jgi:hypothetical protein